MVISCLTDSDKNQDKLPTLNALLVLAENFKVFWKNQLDVK